VKPYFHKEEEEERGRREREKERGREGGMEERRKGSEECWVILSESRGKELKVDKRQMEFDRCG